MHTGYVEYGSLKVGDEVLSEYDELRRQPIRNNHTGTHILNYALREVLGDDVNQKGSLVAPEKLRFDFSHKAGVTDEELEKIEKSCTEYIRQNFEVFSKDVPLATARQINGVRAVFGETYPDPVRVVSVGMAVEDLLAEPSNPEWNKISIEFCGGTHVKSTTEIKDLVVVEESGIAKGIRRVIAFTGAEAHRVQAIAQESEKEVAALEKLPYGPDKEAKTKQLTTDLSKLEISALQKTSLRNRVAAVAKANLDQQKAAQKAEGKKVLDAISDHFAKNADSKTLVLAIPVSAGSKAVQDTMKVVQTKQKDKTVYLIGKTDDGKVVHGCHVSADAQAKGADAAKWSGEVSSLVGGKAGGKGATSLGQGTDATKVDEAVKAAEEYLAKLSLQ